MELYGAGSLKEVMTEMAIQYEKATGVKVNTSFGHSGKMREKAEQSGSADIFTSANMSHPQKLQAMGRSLFVAEFSQNMVCLLSNEKAAVTQDNVLDKMLNPDLKIGIFPAEDPAGEYALEIFKLSGSERQLLDKALVITESMVKGQVPEGEFYEYQLMREGTIDMFLGYCSGEARVRGKKDMPVKAVTRLPAALQVGAHYGLTVLNDAKPEAYQLALFILSQEGQTILQQFGFTPIGLTK